MEDQKSPNKIKREKLVYFHPTNSQLRWKDIKHLELKDDDLILSTWEDGYEAGEEGHWHAEITRMVEETDEQFNNRQADLAIQAKWAKEQRLKTYLKLKEEFEDGE